jgi:hypothetical protein
VKENIAAKALARYRELAELARKSFLGPEFECSGGDECPNQKQYRPKEPHTHYLYNESFTKLDLEERIRTLAVIVEMVESEEPTP